MSAFLYSVGLQFKLDIRSKTMLITCYVVPLLFFLVMGGIFTSINPIMKDALIQSMSVMGVSMAALLGLPPSIVAIYASDIRKMYKANNVPLFSALAAMVLSAFIHMLIMCSIIYIAAPLIFDATPPANLLQYFGALSIFIAVSLSVGSILGLAVKDQAKLTAISQVIFLPSIMLSGIMFPSNLLPDAFRFIAKIFPATWGFALMTNDGFRFGNIYPQLIIFAVAIVICALLLKGMQSE